MNSILLSLDGRAIRRVSGALFGVAMLAACDSDNAVSPAPSSASLPASANGAVVPNKGKLILTAVDQGMATLQIGGSEYDVTFPGPGATIHVVDGGFGDIDKTLGTITLPNFPLGMYHVCQTSAPTGYEIAIVTCVSPIVNGGATTNIGFMSAPLNSLSWDVRRWAGGELIGPAVFSVQNPRTKAIVSVSDNGQNDIDPRLGQVTVKLGIAGTYTVCELMPPPNSYNANPSCITANNSAGRGLYIGEFVNPEKQVYKP